jgi:Ca2+-binding RTX toxin-like protein
VKLAPSNGSVTESTDVFARNSWLYKPNPGFLGEDTFVIRFERGGVKQDISYSINVVGPAKVIRGTEASDQLIGSGGPDEFYGLDGNDVLIGAKGNDILDGGQGIDTAVINAKRSDVQIELDKGAVKVTSQEDGIDTLKGIERIKFNDYNIALDIDGNAGSVAKILGIVFGPQAVKNKEYAGIGLDLMDRGMTFEELTLVAIQTALGNNISNAAVVNLLYSNAAGSPPSAGELATYEELLQNGTFTFASLGKLAANHEMNQVNIGLVGLAMTGLDYLPVS